MAEHPAPRIHILRTRIYGRCSRATTELGLQDSAPSRSPHQPPQPGPHSGPSGTASTETALAAAAMTGDQTALQAIWLHNRRWIAAIILAHKPRWAEVEDLVQDVGTTLVRKISELREPAALKPWLRTVAINTARAAARQRVKNTNHTDVDSHEPITASTGRHQHSTPEITEEAARVMELAMQLPEGYREPLLLRCLKDLSYRQIGELVGLPESTIETRIARGRRMLRELANAPTAAQPCAAHAPTK